MFLRTALMIELEQEKKAQVAKGFLVGIQEAKMSPGLAAEHLSELGELARTLEISEAGRLTAMLREPTPKYLIGSGKAAEIVAASQECGADCLLFDCDLSPSQQRNWEKLAEKPVLDRQEVILNIFAKRASTREASLQVELARLEYTLPRLTRAWTHLPRQQGGAAGTRGEGEKQIELDRRMILRRISQLKKEIKEIRQHRETQRKGRERHELPHAAIVGYTNAGKSSLLRSLTGAEILVENKLFATLDPTTRRFTLPNKQEILLTDTVGFIRKLPHSLVDAFMATLEEASLADFLILMLDASSLQVDEHWETTLSVLDELGAAHKPAIVAFNKMDLLKNDPVRIAKLKGIHPNAVFISVQEGAGLDRLSIEMMALTRQDTEILTLRLPPGQQQLAALAHQKAKVIDSSYDDNGYLQLSISIKKALRSRFQEFIV